MKKEIPRMKRKQDLEDDKKFLKNVVDTIKKERDPIEKAMELYLSKVQ